MKHNQVMQRYIDTWSFFLNAMYIFQLTSTNKNTVHSHEHIQLTKLLLNHFDKMWGEYRTHNFPLMVIHRTLFTTGLSKFSIFMKWTSQLKGFFVIPAAAHHGWMKMDSIKFPLETACHALFAPTCSHIALLFNDQGIWITEREKVGGGGEMLDCYFD